MENWFWVYKTGIGGGYHGLGLEAKPHLDPRKNMKTNIVETHIIGAEQVIWVKIRAQFNLN